MNTSEHRQSVVMGRALYISCVVPVYNEEKLIRPFAEELLKSLQTLTDHYEIIFVNDGSTDQTAAEITSVNSSAIKQLIFSRNFGKEVAISAGLEHAGGHVVIIIDADFQHPFELLAQFVAEWVNGYDMVYGVQETRATEPFFKRLFTRLFYRLMNLFSQIKLQDGAGDFRLMDARVVQALRQFPERGRFMKGLYAWVGFQSKSIPYTVNPRASGHSRWHLRSLAELAITGLTSFSDIPLRIWGLIGLIVSCFSFVFAVYIIIKTLVFGVDTPGYATIMVSLMFFGGLQLLSIGILGEYISRIFTEVKRRPRYLIAQKIGFNE